MDVFDINITDLNNDGYKDIVASEKESQNLSFKKFNKIKPLLMIGQLLMRQLIDFNSDGFMDIASI